MKVMARPRFALFRFVVLLLFSVAAFPLFAWDFQISVSGNTIVVSVYGLTGSNCCAGANVDDPSFASAGCSQPCGNDVKTVNLTSNAVGTHDVWVYAADPTTNGYEYRQGSATVTDPPAPTCPEYDLFARGTTVLTHRYGDGSSYFTPTYPSGQTVDGEIKIILRTRRAPAGTVVNLKVVDPADTAAYGTPHQKDDNLDTAGGTIDGGKTLSVTLPAAGTVEKTLKTTLFASGDNFAVQGSTDPNLISDPNYPCSTTPGCHATPAITAWKRMYVEQATMYRSSQLLADRVLIGNSIVYVNSNSGLRRGDRVRLIHAPSYLRNEPQDVDGYYIEDRTITAIGSNSNPSQPGAYAVTLDAPLTRPYFTDITVSGIKLGDAIVNINAADPMYHFNDQYVVNAFAEAFVEVVKSPTSFVSLPLYSGMTDSAMIFVGAKWFVAREGTTVPSNFGLAVAAATRAPLANANQLSLGTTGGPYSYV